MSYSFASFSVWDFEPVEVRSLFCAWGSASRSHGCFWSYRQSSDSGSQPRLPSGGASGWRNTRGRLIASGNGPQRAADRLARGAAGR
jgi:hypothetical protein